MDDLYEYSRRGMVKEMRELLESGTPADSYFGYDGSSGLLMAAHGGHGKAVDLLLEFGANIQVRTEEGSSALHHAVSGGSVQAVASLIKAGLDVNEANEDGVVPLLLAVNQLNLPVVRLLCDKGANVNAEAEGWGTALDNAEGEVATYLESLGATRSEGGADQPMAAAAERFHYGCFESGDNPHSVPVKAPQAAALAQEEKRPQVGNHVRLRRPKNGLLKEGDVGEVVSDDGSDCLPLKVAFDKGYDYYDIRDVIICEAPVELGPDTDRATAEGTKRYLARKFQSQAAIAPFGTTGLSVSPVGFGCHRVEDHESHRAALELAVSLGCNFVDLAPNYTDGVAEEVAGRALAELLEGKKVRRDEIIIATKVGNVLGRQMAYAEGVPNMAKVNENLSHCISPEWIAQEITRSLGRLQLSCLDCVLLHCPEFETKAPGVDMAEVYCRLGAAFRHLESEVEKGRVSMYGVSAAFYPLRPTDSQHLDLHQVMAQLPEGHHFRVIQFPLNYAEAQCLWVGHTTRDADGLALKKDEALEAPTLFEAAKEYGLATLINRPLDGIYKESNGVLRFSSLDCDVRSFSELQLDSCDVLETRLTKACALDRRPWSFGEGAAGQLAEKTVKTLASIDGVDCVLLGMRRPEYVFGTLPYAFNTPPVPAEAAKAAVRSLHNTVCMWYATTIHEADHGTSKHWRLPVESQWKEESPAAGA